MGNNSILVSKPNYFYQTTADEHLLICLPIQHTKAKSRANPFCMAKLLSTITYWTDARRGQNEAKDLGVFFTLDQWHTLLRGEHSRQAIIDSLDAMVQAGFLELKKKFRDGGGKPHNMYYLQADKINNLILALPDIDPFDIFPHVSIAANNKVTNGTTESQTKVTNGTIDSNKRDYCKSHLGLLQVTNGTTIITTNQVTSNLTTNQSNLNNARGASHKNASQSALFSSEEGNQEPGRKAKKTRGKKEQEQKEYTLPDLTQTATQEILLQQADFYRGGALPVSERADSKFQRALKEGVQPLLTRKRRGGKIGYSLQEIDDVYKLLLRLHDEEWLIDENWNFPVDIWVIAKNIDSKLLLIEKLRKQHAGRASGGSAPGNNPLQSGDWSNAPAVIGGRYGKPDQEPQEQEFDYSLVLWTRNPDKAECQKYMDYSTPAEELKKLRLEIDWEWMHEEEAKQFGWHSGFRFADRGLRELLNDLKRVKGIVLEHHIQSYVNRDFMKPYVVKA